MICSSDTDPLHARFSSLEAAFILHGLPGSRMLSGKRRARVNIKIQ